MDPVTGAVVIAGLKYVGKPSAELVKDFLSRVLAPTGNAVGEAIAHPIVEWQKRRVERAAHLVERAAAIVANVAKEPQPVPGRILWPILERGSVEEDPALSEQWAALLANASMQPSTVLPAFVTILSELSPLEAKLLSHIDGFSVEDVEGEIINGKASSKGATIAAVIGIHALAVRLKVDERTVELLCDNLERLALLKPTKAADTVITTGENRRTALLSAFGNAFMEACSTPHPAEPVTTS